MSGHDKRGGGMTKEERLEWLKCIEKDIYVSSLESTFADDSKSCAIHSIIEELEQEPTTKNDLGVDCISREDALMCLTGMFENREYEPSELIKIFARRIKTLPSVTPQEPQDFKWCTDCREHDQEKHCCHRWSKVIRDTIEEMKQELRKGYLSIDDVMSVFDDFMCGEVDEDGTETFLKMLKDKAESEDKK